MRHEPRATALLINPLAAPMVACVELMRIIPDSGQDTRIPW
jgi:hypothetical protein